MKSESISAEQAKPISFSARIFRWIAGRPFRWWLWCGIFCCAVALLGFVEIKTSLLQSWVFTSINKRMAYELGEDKSPSIAFPRSAPFDDRHGYAKLPGYQSRLESQGYQITKQARQSETMAAMIRHGISPPYPEPAAVGLEIRGVGGMPLFRYGQSEFLFQKLDEVPPLIVKTLLFLENRDLDSPASPWQNPAIEWDRMVKAALTYVGSKLSRSGAVQGGSTLAVQLEKFRHSPNGRTETPLEKLRQVTGASLKAYRAGANTHAWRERIVVDYLNTVPLAAAPGYGEIHGLGEGLHAWFGMALADTVAALKMPGTNTVKTRAFKHVLTLLISLRAPSVFLVEERSSLEQKVGQYTRLLAKAGVIDAEFAAQLQTTPIQFVPAAPLPPQPSSVNNKAANAIRTSVMDQLGIANIYDLHRLHLEVESSIDVALQKRITDFLHSLREPGVVRAHGLDGERLLEGRDPSKLIYSFLLVERVPEGNLVRVQADNLSAPFDINKSVKLELGSTAKLRTITHYLELMAALHNEFASLDDGELKLRAQQGRDPLTRWAAETLATEKNLALELFLERALERKYSASPYEEFFTGGGLHHFENFDPLDNGRIMQLREAFRNSTNLVFIRLMRDMVAHHRARLPYDADDILSNPGNPDRQRMLAEIAADESLAVMRRAYQAYHEHTPEQIVAQLASARGNEARRLAILFFAWRIGSDEAALADWLELNQQPSPPEAVAKLFRAYRNPRLTLADYAYLLSLHPLDLWCAAELRKNPRLTWQDLYAASVEARRLGSAWLLNPRNRRAQDLRLRIRIEKEAFERMVTYWQRLGFPFKTMVPSYASAIGSSSDRPVALAELVGILVNDGVRRQPKSMTKIHFARTTPYETLFEQSAAPGERVLAPEVARAVKKIMAEVVEEGTARRLSGAFKHAGGKPVIVGGKTGSGDNRFETFARSGAVISSRATNRTAAFVFYIGERYYGVVTAYVQGREAADYRFTSALPVTVLKLLAPTIMGQFDKPATPPTAVAPEDNAPAQKIRFILPSR